MLVHPSTQKALLDVHAGTRVLKEDFGLPGLRFQEATEPKRIWEVKCVYAPIPGRQLGGIRVRLEDNRGFMSFLNQRDLEVLLGLGTPGRPCVWTGEDYPEPNSRQWFGLCLDDEDLEDDLLDRELHLRNLTEDWILSPGSEITRRLHMGEHEDFEELLFLRADEDPLTGHRPDPRLTTITNRWCHVERRRTPWHSIY